MQLPLRVVRYFLLICWLLPVLRVAAQPSDSATPSAPTVQPGRLVFRLKPELRHLATATVIAEPTLLAALQRIGATQLHQKFSNTLLPDPEKPGSVDISLIYEIQLPTPTDLDRARHLLQNTGTVLYAEPLYYYAPLSQPNDPLADSTRTDGQSYLRNIRAYSAWDVTKGDTTIVIGISDTGINFDHQDLGQVKYNYADPIDGIDNDHDGYIDNFRGWDLADKDNNPYVDALLGPKKHGVLVTGIAAGTPDNAKGIAGVGYKCRYLPLKIYPSTAQGAFSGYESMVYAAEHGCQVLNVSWGGPGSRSQYEQDVISYVAVNRDVVIVAAAGNNNAEQDFYPASYDHVLSVAGIRADNTRGALTYSRRVDICTLGTDVLTTLGDYVDGYVSVTGSSFAAPIAAGVAALVRSQFPSYSAAQVIAQVRATTNPDIYTLPGNAAYLGKLGTGRLDAYRAVLTTDARAARVVRSQVLRTSTAGQQELEIEVQNLLQPVTNLRVSLTSLSPYLTTPSDVFAVAALPTLGRATNIDKPFRLTVAANTPLNAKALIECRLMADNGFQTTQYLTVVLNPGYVVLDANDLRLTLASQGTLGYDNPASGIGEGITYRQGSSLLYEGGLVVATSPTRVSSQVRGAKGNDQDFHMQSQTLFSRPVRATQEAQGVFQDSLPSATRNRTVGVRVHQHAYAWAAAPARNYVVLQYRLTNMTPDTLKPLYAGLFMDWDLPRDAARNVAMWDASRALGYVYSLATSDLYVGVQVLDGGAPAYYAINNAATTGLVAPATGGFSRTEKYDGLSNGTTYASAGLPYGADVSQLVGAALRALPPGDSTTLTLAVLGASSLPELQAAADDARQRFAQVLPTRPAAPVVTWQAYPNPTTGKLHIEIPPSFSPTDIRLFNQAGTMVLQQAATTRTTLDLHAYPAGLYLLQVRSAGGSTLSQRVVVQP
ncbi:S8 family serine peptidase [Hymenobacter sp. NBH84]|uniref:S8 family peptidase n=1 Tax=Hymenobacter sp. NBH84 TaxID=2596915 RepID=UPI001625B346|nr:S8 family peptidase [Hymenobacter sp. NBH84]QNE38561.1 S8 family serine peptidase [Hymenobacter sp. NBH84]